MSIIENLKNLNFESGATATLTYSDGAEVFVHNETEVETALAETDVVWSFVELIATPGLEVKTLFGTNVLESLRDDGLLDDYERDDTFSDYLNEVITDNFWDVDFIESSTEKYDYKRGFCTLTAEVVVPVAQLLELQPSLTGWSASVRTPAGVLTLE
jgi:hypothetical protein